MEDDLKRKNGRRPQTKKRKTTSNKKMEDDLKNKCKTIFSQFLLNLGANGRRPQKK
jgi:hypothetical protein